MEKILDTFHELLNCCLENEILEFKEAKNNYDFDKLGKYFSALSNEANLSNSNRAWLLFGVRDDKTIIGTKFRLKYESLHNLKAEIANNTTNRITFIEIHELNTEKGRVLLFEIPPAPNGVPIAWKGHYYGRENENLSPLNLEELDRIRRQAKFYDWSAKICEGATIGDLDQKAIAKARQQYKLKHNSLASQLEQWDDVTFLNKAKILIQGKVTNTAIILLGKPESEHFISPSQVKISWILKDKDNLELDYQHYTCPLLLNLDLI